MIGRSGCDPRKALILFCSMQQSGADGGADGGAAGPGAVIASF